MTVENTIPPSIITDERTALLELKMAWQRFDNASSWQELEEAELSIRHWENMLDFIDSQADFMRLTK
jgi:hypothetical protein